MDLNNAWAAILGRINYCTIELINIHMQDYIRDNDPDIVLHTTDNIIARYGKTNKTSDEWHILFVQLKPKGNDPYLVVFPMIPRNEFDRINSFLTQLGLEIII